MRPAMPALTTRATSPLEPTGATLRLLFRCAEGSPAKQHGLWWEPTPPNAHGEQHCAGLCWGHQHVGGLVHTPQNCAQGAMVLLPPTLHPWVYFPLELKFDPW